MIAVEYHHAAEEELNAAAAFYDAQTPGLGEDFLSAVESVEALARTHPALGAPYAGRTRRFLLTRFPFGFIYRERSAELLEVVAVAHLRRQPGYWRSRL